MMMMMTIKRTVLSIMLLLAASAAFCQDDFGIWYNISAEHKLVKRLGLDLSTSIRTFDNAGKIDEAFLEGGLSFKITSFLSVAGAYRITDSREKDDTYHARHKWFADIKGSGSLGNIELAARFRFEKRYKTYYLDSNDNIPVSHGRFKGRILYNIPSFPVNPFISAEIFLPMFSDAKRKIDKGRYSCGAEYNIAKRHSVDLAYIFQRDYLPHIEDINIISLGYNIKF
jgi:hypothetical protein